MQVSLSRAANPCSSTRCFVAAACLMCVKEGKAKRLISKGINIKMINNAVGTLTCFLVVTELHRYINQSK